MDDYLDSIGGFLGSAAQATKTFQDAFADQRSQVADKAKAETTFTPGKIGMIIGGVVLAAVALRFAFKR